MRIDGGQVALCDWRAVDLDPRARRLAPGQRWQDVPGPCRAKPTGEEIAALADRQRARIVEGRWPDLVVADRDGDGLIGRVSWYR